LGEPSLSKLESYRSASRICCKRSRNPNGWADAGGLALGHAAWRFAVRRLLAATNDSSKHWTQLGNLLLRRRSVPQCRGGTKLAFGASCSEGVTSDRPRSISCFVAGTHEAHLGHACRSIKAERPITRAAQGSLPPPLSRSPTLFSICFSTHGTHGRSVCRQESVERLIVLRVAIGPICSQILFRLPEARWSRNPACVWLHSPRLSEYTRAAGGRSHDNLRHIRW
jgi:hypothetical protein